MWWRELERAVSQFVNDVADYFPVEEVDGALGTGGVFLGVCHHDDGGAFGIEFLEELHDLPSILGVEVTCRFIGEYELWTCHHGTGDGHALLLASGELLREMLGAMADGHALHDLRHFLLAL